MLLALNVSLFVIKTNLSGVLNIDHNDIIPLGKIVKIGQLDTILTPEMLDTIPMKPNDIIRMIYYHDSYSDTEPETLVDWIFSKRCGWKQTHGKDVALWFLGGMYRADRCGNTWFKVGDNVETRSSWRKIPNSQVLTLYETYGDMFEESRELVENAKPSWLKRIRPGKRLRKENIILATQIHMKEFVEIMKERHKELPPLRRIT